jgi:hypothetical protein
MQQSPNNPCVVFLKKEILTKPPSKIELKESVLYYQYRHVTLQISTEV